MQKNFFDIPGMGLDQDNPLFSSLNMMRQMWEGMASAPVGMSTPDPKELDKRINELQAVENWLRLNLSMLSSTIQGLEIQRSTLNTLQTFAQQGFPDFSSMTGGLEAMSKGFAGIDPSVASPTKELSEDTLAAAAAMNESNEVLVQAGQAWWGLMQQQFDSLAKATADSMQQAQTVADTMTTQIAMPSADTTLGKKAAKKPKAAKVAKTTKTAAATKVTKAVKAAKKTAAKAAKKSTS